MERRTPRTTTILQEALTGWSSRSRICFVCSRGLSLAALPGTCVKYDGGWELETTRSPPTARSHGHWPFDPEASGWPHCISTVSSWKKTLFPWQSASSSACLEPPSHFKSAVCVWCMLKRSRSGSGTSQSDPGRSKNIITASFRSQVWRSTSS